MRLSFESSRRRVASYPRMRRSSELDSSWPTVSTTLISPVCLVGRFAGATQCAGQVSDFRRRGNWTRRTPGESGSLPLDRDSVTSAVHHGDLLANARLDDRLHNSHP